MIKQLCTTLLLSITILLRASYAQDSIYNKFSMRIGACVTPGLSLAWTSKDYSIVPRSEHDTKPASAYISGGFSSNFYFDRTFISTALLISTEKLHAEGLFLNVPDFIEFRYSVKYLEIPLAVGFILNKNYRKKQTYFKVGPLFSFIFYERINKPIDFIQHSYLGGEAVYEDRVSKKFNYNRTCVFFTLGRESPFNKNSRLFINRGLTFITLPVNIKRNTTEIFTYMRLGIEVGLSYKIK